MKFKIILTLALIGTILNSCHNSDPNNYCAELDSDVFQWIPQNEGDTVLVAIEKDSVPFILEANSYDYEGEVVVFTPGSAICVNDWEARWQSFGYDIKFDLSESDISKGTIWCNLDAQLSFKKFLNASKTEALFEIDQKKNDSSEVISIVLKLNEGLSSITLRP